MNNVESGQVLLLLGLFNPSAAGVLAACLGVALMAVVQALSCVLARSRLMSRQGNINSGSNSRGMLLHHPLNVQ